MHKLILILALIYRIVIIAQTEEELPFYQIPDYPETYTSGTVAARMIDGLGFRYFWATEGLRVEDLKQKASESGRTSKETVAHLYELSKFIRNSILDKNKDENKDIISFEDTRRRTLKNFKIVSDVLRDTNTPYNLQDSQVPFWNIINGPIADALWHCGQLVMLRRASGNPFNSKVSVFKGKVKK